MTTLIGLDLRGRRVVVVGGGGVGTRRARGLATDGAHVAIVDPAPSEAARALAAAPPGGLVELVERPVEESDVDDAWLVVAATANPVVDDAVSGWCLERRTWCIRGARGTARSVASSRHGDLVVGVTSTGDPDPRRVAGVRDALALHVASGAVDLRRRRAHAGRVVLVGTGPGDPGLLTLAGLDALASADVVVTDRLGTREVVDGLSPDVEVVDVGKTSTHHAVRQAEINRILVDRARRGLDVVRLKGGDPFLFGRGAEEVHACRASGVEVHVVPGVPSALAVPGLAGIPVTQRGVATSVHIASGHAGADPAAIQAIAAGATVVLLMAVAGLPDICRAALDAGVSPDLPVAVVERGSTPSQRTTWATVATAPDVVAREGVRPPAVVVLGRVAAEGFLDDPVSATVPRDG